MRSSLLPLKIRSHLGLRAGVVGVAAALLALPLLQAPAAQASPTRSGAHFSVAFAPHTQTFSQAVAAQAASSPSARSAILTTLDAMQKRLSSGGAVHLPPGLDGPSALSRLADQVRALPTASSAAPGAHADAAAVPAALEVPAVPSNPASFPKRGASAGGGYAWKMNFELDGEYCGPTGCELTDRITASLTDNIGAVTTRFNYSALYFPDSGAFIGRHFQAFALCGGTTKCGSVNYPNNGQLELVTPYFYLSSSVAENGVKLAHALVLWADFLPLASYIGDDAKTGTALCNLAPDNRCKF